TAGFIEARCATGADISYWQVPGQDHLGLVRPGSSLEDPLIAWTQERFAGEPAPAKCVTRTIGVTPGDEHHRRNSAGWSAAPGANPPARIVRPARMNTSRTRHIDHRAQAVRRALCEPHCAGSHWGWS